MDNRQAEGMNTKVTKKEIVLVNISEGQLATIKTRNNVLAGLECKTLTQFM